MIKNVIYKYKIKQYGTMAMNKFFFNAYVLSVKKRNCFKNLFPINQSYFHKYLVDGNSNYRVFSPMAWETRVQSLVKSYQRLKKWYLMPPCLTLSVIIYVSRVKWSNPGKEQRLSLHLGVVAIEKGAFESPSTTVANFTNLLYLIDWLILTAYQLIWGSFIPRG